MCACTYVCYYYYDMLHSGLKCNSQNDIYYVEEGSSLDICPHKIDLDPHIIATLEGRDKGE